MITYVSGDLFTSPAQVLVNTVNTVGVMGKGIAKEFKAIYPDMFREYQELCERGELKPGRLMLYRTPHKWILNFPTKRHWRQKSKVEDIEAGLKTFVEQYASFGAHSFAFPQLGCGNGELSWEEHVRPLMERYLNALPVEVYIHTYDQSLVPEHRDARRMREWLRSEPRSLAYSEFWDDVVRIATSDGLATLDTIQVAMSEDEEHIEASLTFITDAGPIHLLRPELFELWQEMRTFGFISLNELSEQLGPIHQQLGQILHQLPYVAEAAFAPVPRRTDPSISISELLASPERVGWHLIASEAPSGPAPVALQPGARGEQLCLSSLTSVR